MGILNSTKVPRIHCVKLQRSWDSKPIQSNAGSDNLSEREHRSKPSYSDRLGSQVIRKQSGSEFDVLVALADHPWPVCFAIVQK